MDITPLLSYLKSTCGIALSCKGFAWRVRSNGFPIRTSKGDLCPENFSLYKLLDYPNLDEWTVNVFEDAIETDDCDHLQLLLDKEASIEAKDNNRETALIKAAWRGNTKCLKLLLRGKANVDVKNNYESTALMYASFWGRTECLQLLLKHNANLEAKNLDGYTALIWAAKNDSTECVKILLGSKANIEAKNVDGYTALIWAAKNDSTECLRILLWRGAKVDPELRKKYPQYSHLWGDSTL